MSRARLRLPIASGLAAAVLAAALPGAAPAAVITIVNKNAAGEGFNDPTAATPVGGNPGTTVGAQRLNAFQYAADVWGSLIDDPIEIKIDASFDALDCNATTGTLGSAGPIGVVSDFPNAPIANTWYAGALANRLAGQNLQPGTSDIKAQFNSKLGQTGCLDGTSWYYGYDNNHGDNIDLVAVLLHEFAHGLGFLTFVDDATATEFNGTPDIFERHILDVQAGKHWDEMTDSERLASEVHTGKLLWDGINVQAGTRTTLDPRPSLRVESPASIAGSYDVGQASFGADLTTSGVSGVLVDAKGPVLDACAAITNPSEVAGKVAITERGNCTFTTKAINAQNAGAIGLVVGDNVQASQPPGMGGDAPTVTIPVVSITQNDFSNIRMHIGEGVAVKIFANPRVLAGAGAEDRMLLYAPNPEEPGSSISHWDTSAHPNLLMEPNLSSDLPHTVDLTLPLLRDIGWAPNSGPAPGLRTPPQQRLQPHLTPRDVERP